MYVRLQDGREYKFTFGHLGWRYTPVDWVPVPIKKQDARWPDAIAAAGKCGLNVFLEDIYSYDHATLCTVTHLGTGSRFVGPAFCSPSDNFCKETGRKLALTRALTLGGFNKEERKAFWDTYLNRKQAKGLKKDAEGTKEGVTNG